LNEGRTQQALGLAKELYKSEKTPVNLSLLQDAYLQRARQLIQQGRSTDARTVLTFAAQLSDAADWRESLARELASIGEPTAVSELLGAEMAPELQRQALEQAADLELQRNPKLKPSLPAEYLVPAESIRQAFALLEERSYDAALAALQPIGLQSPFLEWKLLLRGLSAYYQGDDARAIENWQRLNVARFPAQLAAPFRYLIDADFKAAQSPAFQEQLQNLAERLQSDQLVEQLCAIRSLLTQEEGLQPALRTAQELMPHLRAELPHAVPRLANIFYWALAINSHPDDFVRYERVFGKPADDPYFQRAKALILERIGFREQAHLSWQAYEQYLAAYPERWPGEEGKHARAVIWHRMGVNAAQAQQPQDEDEDDEMAPPWESMRAQPLLLKPSAQECLTRSLALAPDRHETHACLVHYYQDFGTPAEVEGAARRLLEHFPNHIDTLLTLGELRQKAGATAEGLDFIQRALKVNPLDRKLRERVVAAHLCHAGGERARGHYDEARRQYQAALAACDGKNSISVLCKWSAFEFKAGATEQAETLLAQAQSRQASRLALAFSMLIEAIRLKLPPQLKKRFDVEVKAGLKELPAAEDIVALVEILALNRGSGMGYHGQKAHEKLILAYAEKVGKTACSPEQFSSLCERLLQIDPKILRKVADIARRKYAKRPEFVLYKIRSYLKGKQRPAFYRIGPLFDDAHRLIDALPDSTEKQTLNASLRECEEEAGIGRGFGWMFREAFHSFFRGQPEG
jgi:hypothetical protein